MYLTKILRNIDNGSRSRFFRCKKIIYKIDEYSNKALQIEFFVFKLYLNKKTIFRYNI